MANHTKLYQTIPNKEMSKRWIREEIWIWTFHISNGEGQGGIIAARSTSAGVAEAAEKYIEAHHVPLKLKGIDVKLDIFVDDTKTADGDSQGAKASGNIVTCALGELSLRAHPDKTVQILVGHKDWIRIMFRGQAGKQGEISWDASQPRWGPRHYQGKHCI